MYQGNWNEGEEDGEGEYSDLNGNIIKQLWKNGKKIK